MSGDLTRKEREALWSYFMASAHSYPRDHVLRLLDALDAKDAENERLRDAILDIDAHAAPLGEDDDGFVAGGYVVSVGSLHRALALTGAGAECADLPCPRAAAAEAELVVVRGELDAAKELLRDTPHDDTTPEDGVRWLRAKAAFLASDSGDTTP